MYDTYIMKRTQIYLDERQAAELNRRATARGTTASKMIREAIDDYLADPDDRSTKLARFRTALEEGFGSAPHLGRGADYVDRLREFDRSRDEDVQGRTTE